MTDVELYALCKKWGAEALETRRKFIGLLPEVNTRRLYERRKFLSIYHFAAALGGVGKRLVDDVLRLEKRFEEMPNLHAALVNGEIGVSKLSRVAGIANVENQAKICEKIRTLSRRAVEVMVVEVQNADRKAKSQDTEEMFGGVVGEVPQNSESKVKGRDLDMGGHFVELFRSRIVRKDPSERENVDGLMEPPSGCDFTTGCKSANVNSLAGRNHDYEILNALSPQVKGKLKELIDKEIDINAIILDALAARESKIARQKSEIVEAQNAKCKVKSSDDVGVVGGKRPAESRYIPVKIKNLIKLEFGSKCADSGCQNRSEHIHHEKPFAHYREHDPRAMKPLCRGHHELEHAK